MNWRMNWDRLSPPMPMRATSTRGRVVTHRMMMRVVREKPSRSTGKAVSAPKIPASMAFQVLNIPPIRLPPSIKLGGMT